jgi:GNAT superfamily N-acetyltransferase
MAIRAANESDAIGIAHVHIQSWRTTYAGIVPDSYLASLDETERAQLWREWLTRDIYTFVAELDGDVIGFISGGPIREPMQGCDAELYAIYLLKEHQGSRIGTALLRALTTALVSRGFKSMAVWVLEKNPAKDFYVNSGAHLVTSKEIEIGGVRLTELAFCWPDIC